jgi:hypothetical protein
MSTVSKRNKAGPKKAGRARALQRIRSDDHFVDTSAVVLGFSTTTGFSLLNGLVPGVGQNQRLGRKVKLRHLHVDSIIEWTGPGAAQTAYDRLRFLVVYDRESNAAAPAWADIITSTDAASTATSTSWDSMNPSNVDRFMILADRKLFMNNYNAAVNAVSFYLSQVNIDRGPMRFSIDIPLGGLETHFNAGTAGTIADITLGSLYIVTQGISAAGNSNWSCFTYSRVIYEP